MIECMVLGDSIAVGYQQHRTECVVYAKVGLNSWEWNKTYKPDGMMAETVIISLGVNDHEYVRTERELRTLRDKVYAKRVYWIMPSTNSVAQALVKRIASEKKDMIITTNKLASDNIHPSPAGYKELVEKSR